MKRIGARVLVVFGLAFMILFGGYLLYEKVILSLQTGLTHERAGVIERATEPMIFWLWILVYGAAGGLILVAGLSASIWLGRMVFNDTEPDA